MWSGGKDATLTLDVLHSQSPRRIGALLTTVDAVDERVPMHGIPLSLIERQAEAVGIPLHVMRIPPNAPNEVYEERLRDTLRQLIEEGATTVVAGDLFLEDVKSYRKQAIESAGARAIFPLWKRDTTWLSRRFLTRGYRAVVTSVDTHQLDSSFAGRSYDEDFLGDLPEDVDPCGENGEFHTLVTDGPPFRESVHVQVGASWTDGKMHLVELTLADEGAVDE